MKKYLLGVDNGGTYIKAALYDFKGKQIGITKEYNEKIIPGIGMSEYNQDTLWQINCNCIKNVIEGTGIDKDVDSMQLIVRGRIFVMQSLHRISGLLNMLRNGRKTEQAKNCLI